MNIVDRKIYRKLWDEQSSEKSMVFLAGPRQSGKTTLAKLISKNFKNNLYFNWDIISNKKKIIDSPTFFEEMNRLDDSVPLVIFDELHKYKNWKNYLKGLYDEFFSSYKFLVSGSGRLDIYQKGGDSLAGRYLLFRLFPFTISELGKNKRSFSSFLDDPLVNFKKKNNSAENWKKLSELSGFPEPFVKNSKTFWTKWTKNYTSQIIREDIRDISNIKNIGNAEILFSLLSSRIASPLSMNNLAQDIQVAPDTVKNWIELFDTTYLTFRISPWTKKISRAITKERKLYLFNYPVIEDAGARFENMVAIELYRLVYLWNDAGVADFKLHYIKNKEKQEVDFLLTNKNKPFLLVEAKNSEISPSKALINFQNVLRVPAIQMVNKEGVYKIISNGENKVLVTTAHEWFSSAPDF